MKSKNQQSNYSWHGFENQLLLAQQLAGVIAEICAQAIEDKGVAIIALSGGSTPKPLFEALVKTSIDWQNVIITLVDERWVNKQHPLSNEAFIEKHLLNSLPSTVRFASLYQAAGSANESLAKVLQNYSGLVHKNKIKVQENKIKTNLDQVKFDVTVLGMGTDGHTASFFPDADNISELLDPQNINTLLSCESASTQVPRITWSLPVLLNSGQLFLHIVGQKKKQVFDEALHSKNEFKFPICSMLMQDKHTLQVYYSD